MKTKPNFLALAGSTLAAIALASFFALAQGHGNGHGKGHGNNKHGDDDDAKSYAFSDRDDAAMRDWYRDHQNSLPPGLAKKDRLPPGLEKQLVERGTLPPGLQKRIQPCPEDLERRLPPPPPDYAHVVVGGHVVLLNVQTNYVSAVFHLELN